MRFGVLGPLAVWTDHGEPVTVPGRKVRALLADLLVHEGRAVSSDRLVEDLWSSASPADPAAALHVRVSQLRRALESAEPGGRDLVASQPPGYALQAGVDDTVDAARFTSLVEQAQASDDPRTRAGLLAEALGLWRGPALADFADEEFTQAAVARWEEQRLAALEAHAEARLALGEHRELTGELGEHVTRNPFRERLRAAHLRALHRSGRTSEALDAYQNLRRKLADELGLDPGPELAALHQAILTGDPSENAPAPAPRPVRPTTNLPAPVTGLIGRDHAVQRVRELLTAGRLVTLTGPGGVGKTSLAVAVARAQTGTHPDGAWMIDLTTWDGRGDPAELVLSALSVPDAPGEAAELLAAALRERQTLLLFDNCEHVIEPVATLIGGLLPAAPGLRVLATSREPLRLRGEARWDVPPLEIPNTDDPSRLARSPAVRLFLERAGLSGEPEAGVAEVCRRLDGLPLALELAATRVPALGVAELASRLSVPRDRFGLLGSGPRDAPDRQRTLHAVIDWSWRLLTDPEQAVLRRLAVHSGGCTLHAAEALCEGDDVLNLLSALVDRSLVVRGDGARFRLLESVSAYCLDRLREAGEEESLRRRHADYYLALAEQAESELRGPAQREWLLRLDAEAANMRAALEEFRGRGAAGPALRLALALTWYWFLRSRLTEARRALDAALAIPSLAPAALRARAGAWHTGLTIRQGRAVQDRAAEALRDLEAVADPVERARAQWFLSTAIIDFGDETATAKLLASALETSRASADRWCEAAALSVRAMLAHIREDLTALEDDARRSAELFRELGDDWGVLQATDWLIGLADMTGDHAGARRLARDGLSIAEDLGLWSDVGGRLGWLAWTSSQLGDHTEACELAQQAKRLASEQGQLIAEVFATLPLAFSARRTGRADLAEEHLAWLLSSARHQQSDEGSPPYLPMVLTELGLLDAQRGNPANALTAIKEAFELYRTQGTARGLAWTLIAMAAALAQDGRPTEAAQLLGAADAAHRKGRLPLSPSDNTELTRITTDVQAADPDFQANFSHGSTLTPEQARSLVDDGDRA